MKLRILENYLRLRLSQSELKEFEETGLVASQTNFSNATLNYKLISDQKEDDMTADLEAETITIKMPSIWARNWQKPDEVGVENRDQSKMVILVEKDFQCLHKRPKEDESDNFPNPLAKN